MSIGIPKSVARGGSKLMDIPKSAAFTYFMLMDVLRLVAGGYSMLMGIPKSAAGGGKEDYALGGDKKRAGKKVGCDSPPC